MKNFAEFESRLCAIALADAELLSPMLYLDVCFFDHAFLCSDEMESLERQIHEVLFSSLPFAYADYALMLGSCPRPIRAIVSGGMPRVMYKRSGLMFGTIPTSCFR